MPGPTALILCLGAASRMRPLSLGLPKCLLPFCLRPLLLYTLVQLSTHGFGEIVLITGFDDAGWEPVRSWCASHGLRVRMARRGLEFGSAGVVKDVVAELRAEGASMDRFFVIYGDSLLNLDFTGMWTAHCAHHAAITVACHRPDDLMVPGATHTNYGILALSDNGRVQRFREKPAVSDLFSPFASAAVFLMNRETLDFIPERMPADLSVDLIGPVVEAGAAPVFAFDIAPGYRYDIGAIGEYVRRQFDVLEGRLHLDGASATAFMAGEGCAIGDRVVLRGNNIIGDGVFLGAGSCIEDSVILNRAWIGPDVTMFRTVVGPCARIGAGSRLEAGTVIGGWSTVNAGARK